MHSCIYEGTVTHRRREPVTHRFQSRLFMVLLDLDELPSLVGRGLVSTSKRASRSFLRSDHLSDDSLPLATEVRNLVRQRTGHAPAGPIRLLTQLRYFGYYLSPLNLYYVYDECDERVECVVAEVSNTPWNERHCYVLWDGNRTGSRDSLSFAHPKEFHVSPFMGMEMEYRWRLSQPGSHVNVQLANVHGSQRLFGAGMSMQRRELCPRQLRRMMLRYPLMTAQIGAGIYYQALKLWWKRCPYYTHPKNLKDTNHSDSRSPAPTLTTARRTTSLR